MSDVPVNIYKFEPIQQKKLSKIILTTELRKISSRKNNKTKAIQEKLDTNKYNQRSGIKKSLTMTEYI